MADGKAAAAGLAAGHEDHQEDDEVLRACGLLAMKCNEVPGLLAVLLRQEQLPKIATPPPS
jgi:hypothetical protein